MLDALEILEALHVERAAATTNAGDRARLELAITRVTRELEAEALRPTALRSAPLEGRTDGFDPRLR